jgi:hypothetical protein
MSVQVNRKVFQQIVLDVDFYNANKVQIDKIWTDQFHADTYFFLGKVYLPDYYDEVVAWLVPSGFYHIGAIRAIDELMKTLEAAE